MTKAEIIESIRALEEAEQKEIFNELSTKFKTVKAKVSNKSYTRTDKQLAANQSLPKQAKILLEILPTDESISIELWTEKALEAGLETKQEPVRITMYYRPMLIANGFVEETK